MLKTLLAGGLIGATVAMTGCASDKLAIHECEPAPVVIQQEESNSEQPALPSLFCLMQDEDEYVPPIKPHKREITPAPLEKPELKPEDWKKDFGKTRFGSDFGGTDLEDMLREAPHPTDKGVFDKIMPPPYMFNHELYAGTRRRTGPTEVEDIYQRGVMHFFGKEAGEWNLHLDLIRILQAQDRDMFITYDRNEFQGLFDANLEVSQGYKYGILGIKGNVVQSRTKLEDESVPSTSKEDSGLLSLGAYYQGGKFKLELVGAELGGKDKENDPGSYRESDFGRKLFYGKANLLLGPNLLFGLFGSQDSFAMDSDFFYTSGSTGQMQTKYHENRIGAEFMMPYVKELYLNFYFQEFHPATIFPTYKKFGGAMYWIPTTDPVMLVPWGARDNNNTEIGVVLAPTRYPYNMTGAQTTSLKGKIKDYLQTAFEFRHLREDLTYDQRGAILQDKFNDTVALHKCLLAELSYGTSEASKMKDIRYCWWSVSAPLPSPLDSLTVGVYGRQFLNDKETMRDYNLYHEAAAFINWRCSKDFSICAYYSCLDYKNEADDNTFGLLFKVFW